MSLLLAVVLGWCLLSVAVAFGRGPILHKAAVLAEARDAPRPTASSSISA
ncbi:MAG: hypothetical protein ABJC62_03180 [Frankiaceae bacterium]